MTKQLLQLHSTKQNNEFRSIGSLKFNDLHLQKHSLHHRAVYRRWLHKHTHIRTLQHDSIGLTIDPSSHLGHTQKCTLHTGTNILSTFVKL